MALLIHNQVRRVKCDETHPACMRCTSTGRTCDGNDAAYSALSVPSPSPEKAMTISTSSGLHEARSLQFFVERTIGQLTAFFPDDLWRTQVLQVAQSEAGIRHALISFAAYHEAYTNDSTRDEMPFALRHYNLSIQKLRESQHQSSWTYINLVSCSIFICIELLRGHFETATRLFKYGHGMIHESQQQADRHSYVDTASVPDTGVAMELVEAFFARLAIQLVGDVNPELSLRSISGFRPTQPVPDLVFKSLSDARAGLLDLSAKHMASLDENCGCAALVDALGRWTEAFDAFMIVRSGLAFSAAEKRSIALIELHKRYLNLSLMTTHPGDTYGSINWDHYVDDVDEMLDYAGLAVQQNVSEGSARRSPQFHMDIGVVPILFYIVVRCRDPRIRRKAIHMMSSAQAQEGFWNCTLVSRVAQRIMASEESGMNVSSCDDIPYIRRVRKALVFLIPGERRATIEYRLQNRGWQESLEW